MRDNSEQSVEVIEAIVLWNILATDRLLCLLISMSDSRILSLKRDLISLNLKAETDCGAS